MQSVQPIGKRCGLKSEAVYVESVQEGQASNGFHPQQHIFLKQEFMSIVDSKKPTENDEMLAVVLLAKQLALPHFQFSEWKGGGTHEFDH